MELLTIGYEGLTTHGLLRLLRSYGIQTLVDVRELPLSRKPGFSKSALATVAARRRLRYLHIPELGCPREIRHDYRADGNWDRYLRRFSVYLSTQDDAVASLAHLARTERCCLLCFEADARYCHRSLVAARVAPLMGQRTKVVHITQNQSVAVPHVATPS